MIQDLIDNADCETSTFEVDPIRTEKHEDIEVNQRNLMRITQTVFDSITSSSDRFPSQLRSMCHCLYQVMCKRFPNAQGSNIGSVGTVMFLRFINPAIVSPYEMGKIILKCIFGHRCFIPILQVISPAYRYRRKTASSKYKTWPHADVQDVAEYCQSRRVFQRKSHVGI